MTVEVLDQRLSESDARALTNELQRACTELSDWYDHVIELVQRAYRGQAWLVLGHPSWETYLKHELPFRPALDRDVRRTLVAALRKEGLSTRAIAPVAGASKDTVQRDAVAGVSNDTPDLPAPPARVNGTDGRSYPAPAPRPAITPPADPPVSAQLAVAQVSVRVRKLLAVGTRTRREVEEVVRLRGELPDSAVRDLVEALSFVCEQAGDLVQQLQEGT